MANMYDEFERAVGEKRGRGVGLMGGLLIAALSLFFIGALGVGFAAWFVHDRVEHFAREASHQMVRAMDRSPALMAAELVDRMGDQTRLIAMDPAEGLDFLRNVPMDAPPEDFLQEMLSSDVWQGFPEGEGRATRRVDRRTVSVRGEDGAVSIDVVKGEDGGSLVIGSPEGEVRFDLERTGDGGHLTMISPEGEVHMELARTGDGGFLTIDSREGQIRFDLVRKGEGGELTVQSPEGTFRFGAAEGAEPMPRWVPPVRGMPGNPEGVYSLTSPEGFLGAVTWESDDGAQDVIRFYQGLLEGKGFELMARHRVRDAGMDHTQSSLWARNEAEGRMVFLVADQADGATRVLLGYGEER